MTLEQLNAKVRIWDFQHTGDPAAKAKYGIILDQLYHHAGREWRVYHPADHPDFNASYMERLAAWVGNVPSDADQKLLLEYALYISFFSHDDFAALYRTAMDREILRWITQQLGIGLSPNGGRALHNAVAFELFSKTWYCPITDSMDINEFHKVNHIPGVSHRPGFASLQMVAEHPTDPNPLIGSDWIRYMRQPSSNPLRPSLNRLVLLEDIVGSATQCIGAVRWAVATLGVPVLFVPLILCPNGVMALRALEAASAGRLTIRPVIELRRNDLLGPERQGAAGWPIANEIEDLADRHALRASPGLDTFGYLQTGCSMATFSNTPDNTLPIVHNKPATGTWEPLYPRIFRGA